MEKGHKGFSSGAHDLFLGDRTSLPVEHRLLNLIILSTIIASFFGSILNIILRIPLRHTVFLFGVIVVFWGLYILSRVKRVYYPVLYTCLFLGLLSIVAGFVTNGGITGGFQYMIFPIAIFYSFLMPKEKRWWLFVLYLVAVILMVAAQYMWPQYILGYRSVIEQRVDVFYTYLISVCVIFFIVCAIKNELDIERINAQESLRQADEAGQKNEYLIKVFAHDIKNYLQADLHLLRSLKMKNVGGEEVDEVLIDQQHINRMVLNLINVFSDSQIVLNKRRVGLQVIRDAVVADWDMKFKRRNIAFEVNYDKDLFVNIDITYAGLVWDNLLANAYQHTPDGGVIKAVAKRLGDKAVFYIYNSGEVVPVEQRPYLFDKYATGKGSTPFNKGLGLHCVKMILQKHGGAVSYRVTQDGLNEFIVVLDTIP